MAKQRPINKTNQPQARPQAPAKPAPQPAKPKKPFNPDTKFVLILIAIAFIINARTITYSYTYDDAVFTSENSYIGLKGIGAIPGLFTHAKNYNFDKSNTGSYRPLLPVTFAIEHEFFGFNPMVSHTINLLLFGLLIFVLYKLLRRMFANYSAYIPFLILLLYELHPIHTEVVASVKSRDELLALLFTVMGMLQSFKYIDDNKIIRLVLSGFYFMIALMAKESVVPFVGMVPLTLYFFSNAKLSKLAVATVPYFVSAVVFVLLGIAFLDKVTTKASVAITENAIVGAKNFSEKLGTILVIQLKYLQLLVFPHPLSFDYGFNQIPFVPFYNFKALICLILVLAMLVYAVVNFKRKDVFAYSILFYFMAVSVTSNLFIEIGATMGERFLFISSLGFCIAVVFLLVKAFKVDATSVSYQAAPKLSYVIIAVSILYSAKTMARNEDWKNNFELFNSGVEVCPNSWRTQHCIGEEYKLKVLAETDPVLKKKYTIEAIDHFNKANAIYANKADTHADLGAVYFTDKNYDSAKVHLKRALELNPKLSAAAANMGTVYLTEQNYPIALNYYRQTVDLDPNNITAVFNEAVCWVQVQKLDSAVLGFKHSVILAPDYYNHKGLEYIAITYKMMGKMDSAIKYMGLAKVNNPAFAL